MKNNIIFEKSKKFAVRIIKFCNMLRSDKNEYIISKQLFRSGTSIGANIAESEYASSMADFVNKLQIALKETNESIYWVSILLEADYIDKNTAESIIKDLKELIKILISSIKTAKTKINN